jgi:hypothetical protein
MVLVMEPLLGPLLEDGIVQRIAESALSSNLRLSQPGPLTCRGPSRISSNVLTIMVNSPFLVVFPPDTVVL